MQIFSAPNYDFIRWRWHALILSAVVILAGVAYTVAQGGLPLGVDFSGGTIVVVKFQEPVSEQVVRDAIPGDEEVVQTYGEPGDHEILVRLPQIEGAEEGTSLEEGASRVGGGAPGSRRPGVRDGQNARSSAPSSAASCSSRGSTPRWRRLSASRCTSRSASARASRSAPSRRRSTTSW